MVVSIKGCLLRSESFPEWKGVLLLGGGTCTYLCHGSVLVQDCAMVVCHGYFSVIVVIFWGDLCWQVHEFQHTFLLNQCLQQTLQDSQRIQYDSCLHDDVIGFLEAGKLFLDISRTLAIFVGVAALHKVMQVLTLILCLQVPKECEAGFNSWRVGRRIGSHMHLIVARLHCCKHACVCCF